MKQVKLSFNNGEFMVIPSIAIEDFSIENVKSNIGFDYTDNLYANSFIISINKLDANLIKFTPFEENQSPLDRLKIGDVKSICVTYEHKNKLIEKLIYIKWRDNSAETSQTQHHYEHANSNLLLVYQENKKKKFADALDYIKYWMIEGKDG